MAVRSWQAAYAHVLPAERLAGMSPERRAELGWLGDSFVVELDGEVVGFVDFGESRDDDAEGEIYAIYVEPDHFGAGMGRELIRAAELRMHELGFTHVILWVLEDNPRARRFYEAAGWTLDGTCRPIEIFGIELPEVRYRKKL